MKELIEDFTKHITASIEISNGSSLNSFNGNINNVLICGLGGSGIGASIISQVVAQDANCPITINKDYKIPAFVNENTLVICCSYSGNTEESLEMLVQAEAKNAVIACVTSGGKLAEIVQSKNCNQTSPSIIINQLSITEPAILSAPLFLQFFSRRALDIYFGWQKSIIENFLCLTRVCHLKAFLYYLYVKL